MAVPRKFFPPERATDDAHYTDKEMSFLLSLFLGSFVSYEPKEEEEDVYFPDETKVLLPSSSSRRRDLQIPKPLCPINISRHDVRAAYETGHRVAEGANAWRDY